MLLHTINLHGFEVNIHDDFCKVCEFLLGEPIYWISRVFIVYRELQSKMMVFILLFTLSGYYIT